MSENDEWNARRSSLRAGVVAATLMVFACFGAAVAFSEETAQAASSETLLIAR
ncbi:hypothetical protein [uncultured Erythrobacter sp.]|uniref:hypothetical protein n=1 Tax=uncultured Erythrobacter sp. TaxID=263913 RepID=UPI00261F2D0A|nr:hypothetical protein [uncultured Erythrobacter sp.]